MDAAVKDIAAQAQRIQRRHSHTASQLKLTGTITSTRAAVMALAPLPVEVTAADAPHRRAASHYP